MISRDSSEVDVALARAVVDAVKDAMFWRGPTDGGSYDAPIWLDQALDLVAPEIAEAYRREVLGAMSRDA